MLNIHAKGVSKINFASNHLNVYKRLWIMDQLFLGVSQGGM